MCGRDPVSEWRELNFNRQIVPRLLCLWPLIGEQGVATQAVSRERL